MITPMQMYWLLKLDDIGVLCIYSIFVSIALLAISIMAYDNSVEERNEKEKKMRHNIILFSSYLWCIFRLR